jgi:hypothetical protein
VQVERIPQIPKRERVQNPHVPTRVHFLKDALNLEPVAREQLRDRLERKKPQVGFIQQTFLRVGPLPAQHLPDVSVKAHVGNTRHDAAVGFQQFFQLCHHRPRIGRVLQHVRADDAVHRALGKRQRHLLDVTDHHVIEPAPRFLARRRKQFGAINRLHARLLFQPSPQRSFAAAHVEHHGAPFRDRLDHLAAQVRVVIGALSVF